MYKPDQAFTNKKNSTYPRKKHQPQQLVLIFLLYYFFSNITRLKTALVEKDLVEMNGQKFYITDPVFALWFESKL